MHFTVLPLHHPLTCCRKYNAFNLARPLGPDDLLMMERVAGFHEPGHENGTVKELTPHQWAFFGVWYLRYTNYIQHCLNCNQLALLFHPAA